MKIFIVCYLVFINLLAVLVCSADKIKAIRHSRRIRERTLWIISFLGGSAAMYLTMNIIRHKTKHKSFMLGLPALLIFQIIIVLLLTNLYVRHIIA
ncbi:MAG: DUF1294 domain-containing protein [Clostridia bacterium]|nr:DUF1294 domain-containing protein [Clostridia bacterium]